MTQGALFKEQKSSSAAITANIDGGARGNPGPAAFGVVIRGVDGKVIKELSEYLGHQTNNFAEYSGLLAALDYAVREKLPTLKVRSDSELLVRQMKGIYKVKSPALQELFAQAQSLARKIPQFSIEHVFREQNKDADRLVNQVLDSHNRVP